MPDDNFTKINLNTTTMKSVAHLQEASPVASQY